MKPTSELFSAIENTLVVSQDMANGMHQRKHDETIETTLNRKIPDAQSALAELKQRVADLEAFYQHMIDDEYHYEYLASIEAHQQIAANHDNDDEYTRLGIDAQLFRDLLSRLAVKHD